MKKIILIASAVALAMDAQCEVRVEPDADYYYENSTEYINPYKGYAYDYVSQYREHGLWYIDNESEKNSFGRNERYPVLEEYNNEIFLKVGSGGMETNDSYDEYYYKVVYLCIGFDFSDILYSNPYLNDKYYLNLKAKVFKLSSNEDDTTISVSQYYINDDDKWHNICGFRGGNKDRTFDYYPFDNDLKLCNKDNIESFETNTELQTRRFVIDFSLSKKDFYYFKDIVITITDANGTVYFQNAYFTEEERQGLITTSINDNDMESNTYVSNNVLYTDEPSSVYIFNAGGILVKTENNTTSVDLSSLKKGVYIAKVNGAPIRFVR